MLNYLKADFEGAAGIASQIIPPTLPEVAFSGRSNVGKSSLINKILNRKGLARTSATPGKTATINFYNLVTAYFMDLPGYGYAKVSKAERLRWSELIEGYFNQDRDLRLVVQLIDMRHPASQEDYNMLDYLWQREIPFIVVLTKADKLKKQAREKRMKEIEEEFAFLFENEIPVIPFSADNGENVEKIRAILEDVTSED